LTFEPHLRVKSDSNAESDQNDENDVDGEQSISACYRVHIVGRWPVCKDTQWYRSHCEGGRDAGVDASAAMVTTILMEVREGESPSRNQGAAQMLVTVFTAKCLLWLTGSSRPMGNESREPGGEWKDKHVRDRVETKGTMRGLHVVVWTNSLIIAGKSQLWPLAAEARYEDLGTWLHSTSMLGANSRAARCR
jgi:hypothetical protein